MTFDAAVIGAGSFGSWIALTLARRGLRVALADSHGPGNSRSSSGDETRIIRSLYGDDALYSRMALESLTEWKALFAEAGQPHLFIHSGVLLTNTVHATLTTAELRKRFPQFKFAAGTAGLFEPDAGILLARRAVQCVTDTATRLGVTLLNLNVNPRTIRKLLPAQHYIFACGPWLPTLFPKALGNRIFPTRQTLALFGTPAGNTSFLAPEMPAWVDFSTGLYSVPDIENRGVKFGFDTHGPAIDPEHDSRLMTAKEVGLLCTKVAQTFPTLKAAPLFETRVCVYENTSNGDFLIDRLSDDLWIAGGGSGHGFKHGPMVARYVADLLENRIEREPRFSIASKPTKQARCIF